MIANKTKIINNVSLSLNDLTKLNSNKLTYEDKGTKTDYDYTQENIICHNKIVGRYKWGFNSTYIVVVNETNMLVNQTFYNSTNVSIQVNNSFGDGTSISGVFNLSDDGNATVTYISWYNNNQLENVSFDDNEINESNVQVKVNQIINKNIL